MLSCHFKGVNKEPTIRSLEKKITLALPTKFTNFTYNNNTIYLQEKIKIYPYIRLELFQDAGHQTFLSLERLS